MYAFITVLQVLLAYAGEDWKAVIQEHRRSAMHVVMPITLTANLHKCMVTDDPRLPKMKLCAELGKIDIQLPGMKANKLFFSCSDFCFKNSLDILHFIVFSLRGSLIELNQPPQFHPFQ